MPFVSITRVRVRSWRFLSVFFIQAFRSARQAKFAAGNLAVTTLRDTGSVFWTRTLWESEDAMRSFMLAGPHRRVMPRLLEWCDEAALVHWVQDLPAPPSWEEAHQRLQHEGRRMKVKHPSAAQRSYDIPLPKMPRQELRFK